MIDPFEARAALASVDDATRQIARTMDVPLWRHLAFGLIEALLVGSQALVLPFSGALFVLAMAGVALIARYDRKRYGVFVNGFRRGATLPITLATVAVLIVLVLAEMQARVHGLSDWTLVALPVLGFVITAGFSIAWQHIYRRDLTARAGA